MNADHQRSRSSLDEMPRCPNGFQLPLNGGWRNWNILNHPTADLQR